MSVVAHPDDLDHEGLRRGGIAKRPGQGRLEGAPAGGARPVVGNAAARVVDDQDAGLDRGGVGNHGDGLGRAILGDPEIANGQAIDRAAVGALGAEPQLDVREGRCDHTAVELGNRAAARTGRCRSEQRPEGPDYPARVAGGSLDHAPGGAQVGAQDDRDSFAERLGSHQPEDRLPDRGCPVVLLERRDGRSRDRESQDQLAAGDLVRGPLAAQDLVQDGPIDRGPSWRVDGDRDSDRDARDDGVGGVEEAVRLRGQQRIAAEPHRPAGRAVLLELDGGDPLGQSRRHQAGGSELARQGGQEPIAGRVGPGHDIVGGLTDRRMGWVKWIPDCRDCGTIRRKGGGRRNTRRVGRGPGEGDDRALDPGLVEEVEDKVRPLTQGARPCPEGPALAVTDLGGRVDTARYRGQHGHVLLDEAHDRGWILACDGGRGKGAKVIGARPDDCLELAQDLVAAERTMARFRRAQARQHTWQQTRQGNLVGAAGQRSDGDQRAEQRQESAPIHLRREGVQRWHVTVISGSPPS